MSGPRCIEIAGPERVRSLLSAPNIRIVRRHKDQAVVEIQLLAHGDDSRLHARDSNPQKLSHNSETPENPKGVWTLKKLEHGSVR